MGFRPLSLCFVRNGRARSVTDVVEGGPRDGGEKTQDGTVDVNGRVASKQTTGGWRGALFVIVQQLGANTAWFGVASNLVVYLTTIMHQNNSSAARNVTNWNGAGYIAALLGGYLADSYFGRFMSAVVFSVLYIVGLVMLTVAGSVKSLRPPQCATEDLTCQEPSLGQAAFFYVSLYTVTIGSGGVQGTVVTFGADQFDEEDDDEKLQKSSFFNWVYQINLIGSFITVTFFVYIQENFSFGIGWGMALALQMLATIILVAGMRLYRYHKPGGNPLVRMAQVIIACFRNWQLKVQSVDDLYEVQQSESIKGGRRIQHSKRFLFLDKAAIVTAKGKAKGAAQNPWKVCTVSQVEEVKFVLCVLPIYLTGIIYTTCYGQLATLFIEQGYTMDRNLGSFVIPAASIDVFESVSVLFWVILWDRVLVPCLRKRTGNQRGISELQRIGIGLALSILSMTLAAIVEIERLRIARDHGLEDDPNTPVPMSVFWEVPQYFVMGASEMFTYIGLMEFFYDQAPDAIRSVGSSLSLSSWGLGYIVSSLLVTIVGHITRRGGKPGWIADNLNQGRVDLFYWLLAILSFVNLVAFVLSAMRYEYMVTQGPVPTEYKVVPEQVLDQEGEIGVNDPLSSLPDSTMAER